MSKVTFTMMVSFMTNTVLSTVKVFLGLFLNSMSVIIDGIQTFSDMSTDMITISEDNFDKVKDKKLKRSISFITGFTILFLGLASVFLATTKSLKTPHISLLLIVPILIVAKYILSTYVLEKGIKYNDVTLIKCSHENDLDVISSIIVLFGLILIQLKDVFPILEYSDMITGVIVACFIIKVGFDVISHEINDIMAKPYVNEEMNQKIDKIIKSNNNVLDIPDLEILKYGPFYELRVSIILNDNLPIKYANEIAHSIEKKVKIFYPDMEYITIKINNEKLS